MTLWEGLAILIRTKSEHNDRQDAIMTQPALREETKTPAALRDWLARQAAGGGGAPARPLGIAPLDRALAGGGLATVGLHCLGGLQAGAAAPLGLALAFAARLRAGKSGPLIWVAREDFPYAPGLGAFGLAAEDLLLVRAEREQALLWALEECLRSGEAPVVLGRLQGLERVAGRRLQLAAERGGAACLLIETRPSGAPLPALTRWQVAAAASSRDAHPSLIGRVRWRLRLQQSRGGRPAEALVEWDDATYSFSLVAASGERDLAADAQACG
ncbi:MAG: hypothetical protein Kilf2KO_37610 [Rhodospirillales bacterium]